MNTYYVYILQCIDGSYYVGVTNDLERRFKEHQEGVHSNSFTYKRRPVELKYYESFNDVNRALARETQLKGWSKKKKDALISGNIDLLRSLSKGGSTMSLDDHPVG